MINNERKFIVVGLGEILWDLLPDGRQLGGAPANFAYHARALGAQGVVVSCVGNDQLGREILDNVERLGLSHEYISVDKDHPTGTVTVEIDKNGKPDYIIHENVAWDFIPLSSGLLELAARADAVYFGSLCQRSKASSDTVRKFLQAAKPDCLRVFDINLRQSYYSREVIDTMLRLTNVFKLNDEELLLVARLLSIKGPESEILAELIACYNLRLIVLTKGSIGSRLYAPQEDSVCKGFRPAELADTVGAGDAFTAAVTVGFLNNEKLDTINENANRLASFVCSQRGATPKIPHSLIESFHRNTNLPEKRSISRPKAGRNSSS